MSALRTAFYVKNIPGWERLLRVALSTGATVYGWSLPAPWSWVITLSAIGFALTGLVGFCPACAMLGRRSLEKATR